MRSSLPRPAPLLLRPMPKYWRLPALPHTPNSISRASRYQSRHHRCAFSSQLASRCGRAACRNGAYCKSCKRRTVAHSPAPATPDLPSSEPTRADLSRSLTELLIVDRYEHRATAHRDRPILLIIARHVLSVARSVP